MQIVLDAWVQLIQVALLFVVITQNFGLRRRIRNLETKLGGETPRD